jgi:peptidase C39-like protein
VPVSRRTFLGMLGAGAVGLASGPAPVLAAAAKAAPVPRRDIVYRSWRGAMLGAGTLAGTALTGDALTIAAPLGTATYTDPYLGTTHTYEYATWISPQVGNGFAASEAVASWNADTPGESWLQVELRGTTAAGTTTKWYVMGRWAADDHQIYRTSVPAQSDVDGTVSIDTFVATSGHGLTAWQLRVTLYRPAGTTQTPALRAAGAMASLLPAPGKYPASTPATALGVTLPVPQYSQEIHIGQYPQWDGGGEAWCSPTSTSMVVAYWGTGPTPTDYAWVDPSFADPWVDYAARNTYDYNYQGCGNWPFNTAYAARFGLDAFVTRMRTFNEVEQFIAAGVPVVVSAAFKKNQVPGANYGTNGHLMVIVGFTTAGDPVMNDPFSATDAEVRKVFGRAEFEAAWQNSSGGTVYVIHPSTVALPAPPAQANW